MGDIRIDFSFSTHRKRKRLEIRLGSAGVVALLDLWIDTAQNRPKGILHGMDETDIALAANWTGDPKDFCQALVETKFLDQSEEGVYSLHDWEQHQGWVFGSEERSAQSREAALIRWGRERRNKARNGDEIRLAYDPHTDPNAPSPNPSPEKEIKEKIKEGPSSSFSKNLQTKRRYDDGNPYPTGDSF